MPGSALFMPPEEMFIRSFIRSFDPTCKEGGGGGSTPHSWGWRYYCLRWLRRDFRQRCYVSFRCPKAARRLCAFCQIQIHQPTIDYLPQHLSWRSCGSARGRDVWQKSSWQWQSSSPAKCRLSDYSIGFFSLFFFFKTLLARRFELLPFADHEWGGVANWKCESHGQRARVHSSATNSSLGVIHSSPLGDL